MVEIVPVVLLPPDIPFTCHVTDVLLVFCTVAVNCCVVPAGTVADVGDSEMVTPTAVVMVTVAEADLVVSAWETAVTVTVAGLGTVAGAVYKPAVEIVPTVLLPAVTPFTCHVTAVLLVFFRVAVNCCVVPAVTLAVVGATETLITTELVTVTKAEADFVGSACETAVTVTVAGLGTVAGAV